MNLINERCVFRKMLLVIIILSLGYSVTTIAEPGFKIQPKVLKPHFNVPSARPTAVPCSNLIFQGVRITGTDFFDLGRNANSYRIHLLVSVLNSGNAPYIPKQSDKLVVTGRDMGARSALSSIPRMDINRPTRLRISAIIQGRLAPRNILTIWFTPSTNACSNNKNIKFIVNQRQLRAGFLTARNRARSRARSVHRAEINNNTASTPSNTRMRCPNTGPDLKLSSVQITGTDFFKVGGQYANHYYINLKVNVLNSGNMTYTATPSGRLKVSGRDMESQKSYSTMIPNLTAGKHTIINMSANIPRHLAPRNSLTLSVDSLTKECDKHNNNITLSIAQIREAFRAARSQSSNLYYK